MFSKTNFHPRCAIRQLIGFVANILSQSELGGQFFRIILPLLDFGNSLCGASLNFLKLILNRLDIDRIGRDGAFGQDGQVVFKHLSQTAVDEKLISPVLAFDSAMADAQFA